MAYLQNPTPQGGERLSDARKRINPGREVYSAIHERSGLIR